MAADNTVYPITYGPVLKSTGDKLQGTIPAPVPLPDYATTNVNMFEITKAYGL